MCRCCQRCWEDFYWNCIEEKFCYDESIANYDPTEDEYYMKKTKNGFLPANTKADNNLSPICNQPVGLHRQHSSKIHEEDYREVQINGPILAPEIISVFQNSQIFHDHQPTKKSVSPVLVPVHGKSSTGESDSDKLLSRLEGKNAIALNSSVQLLESNNKNNVEKKIHFTIDDGLHSDDDFQPSNDCSLVRIPSTNQFPSIREEEIDENAEIVLRPNFDNEIEFMKEQQPIQNKRLRNVQSVPYFSVRPASETDIFSISGSMNQISMTPEIPSISYSTLPKNYEATPTIGQYKETVSLYSIQTANSARILENDFSMPRNFRRPEFLPQISRSSSSIGVGTDDKHKKHHKSADTFILTHTPQYSNKSGPKKVEKSKRLQLIRDALPPLSIHLSKEKLREKHIE